MPSRQTKFWRGLAVLLLCAAWAVAAHYASAGHGPADFNTALGCLPPTVEPRATDNIKQMIDIIEKLLARGHAYEAAGEVLFDTKSMADYGELSKRPLDEQQAGARIAVDFFRAATAVLPRHAHVVGGAPDFHSTHLLKRPSRL